MRIIIIRHADPDYPNHCLTPKGEIEAKTLGEFYKDFHYDRLISSTMPRALLTAEQLAKYHPEIPLESDDHLREFTHKMNWKDSSWKMGCWDMLPEYFTKQKEFYRDEDWFKHPVMKEAGVDADYLKTIQWLDNLLAEYGYQRDGKLYRCEQGNHKTLVLVCHFGMMCVLLSHLLNISFTQLSDGTCCLPTGVSEIYTEERRKGIVKWRLTRFGDLTHLNAKGIPPSFSARFCETYEDDTRHD